MQGYVELPPQSPEETVPPRPRLRLHHFLVAFAVSTFYLAAHRYSLAVGIEPVIPLSFTLVFTSIAAVAAVLATMFYYDKSIVREWSPGAELGIQTLIWNPMLWLTCMGVFVHFEDHKLLQQLNPYLLVAILMLLGVAASFYAAFHAQSVAWKVVYSTRGLQAFFAGFIPLFPPAIFLLVLFACAVCDSSQRRYFWTHWLSLMLLIVEQVAAVAWFVFCFMPAVQ